MISLLESCFYFISGHGRGWVFTSNDLLRRYTRQQADELLHSLTNQGKIRRIAHGMYDYPRYSDLLKTALSPDIDQAAQAYARKFNWRIETSGETALNLLGLSTQVPATYLYLSDGPNRRYEIMGQTLVFKKSALKNIGFKYRESSLLAQALMALGKEQITPKVIKKMCEFIKPEQYEKILKDTRTSTGWAYETIKKICRSNQQSE